MPEQATSSYCVDPFDEQILTTLAEQLASEQRSDVLLKFYALIDMSLAKGARHLYQRVIDKGGRSIFAGAYIGEGLDRVAPHLLPLAANPDERVETLEWLLEATSGRAMLSFIAVREGLDDLVAGLQANIEARLPDGQLMLLRYGDTRCLPAILETFDASQRERLLSAFSRWWYFDRKAQLQVVHGKANGHVERASEPFRLTNKQVEALRAPARPDRILYLVQKNASRLGELRIAPSDAYRVLFGAMSKPSPAGENNEGVYQAALTALIGARAFGNDVPTADGEFPRPK